MPRVLVLEDDAFISDLVSEALHDHGFEVDRAENGVVGLTKVSERPPDLITLDLMMPVMDGWEFLRRYRDLPNCADTPILVMSAIHRAQLDLLEHCEVLTKPFDLDELMAVVGRLVPPGA